MVRTTRLWTVDFNLNALPGLGFNAALVVELKGAGTGGLINRISLRESVTPDDDMSTGDVYIFNSVAAPTAVPTDPRLIYKAAGEVFTGDALVSSVELNVKALSAGAGYHIPRGESLWLVIVPTAVRGSAATKIEGRVVLEVEA